MTDLTRTGQPRAKVRREYRADLRAQGITDVADMAAAFRDRWSYGWLRSFRVACGLSAAEAAYQFNSLFNLVKGDKGYLHVSVVAKYETYPDHRTSRRPVVSCLVGLSVVYGTRPRILLDPALRDRYHRADLYLLDTYRPPRSRLRGR